MIGDCYSEPYPFVCANCKWMGDADEVPRVKTGRELHWCHRYPQFQLTYEHEWCGEFDAAYNREMRSCYPYPKYQKKEDD